MKTGVTITTNVQIGMDTYKDFKETMVCDDSTTLLEIKEWIHSKYKSYNPNYHLEAKDISLGMVEFSDIS